MGLLIAALAVRWPNLLLSPEFPSVGATIVLALDVSSGRSFPLADQAPYIGAPFVYLLAAVYRLVGPSVEATSAVPWAIGALTVLPTYLLGREIGGWVGGLVAGGLLAASAAHTVITSHVPLSHSLTPLVATTTLWLVARALTRHDGRSLALAGLGAGLSLQTHPTVAPLLLGAGAGVLVRRPGWVRSRWPYLAATLALLGYSTLLVNAVQTRFAVISDVQDKQTRYLIANVDAGKETDHSVYEGNLGQLGRSLVRLTSGALLDRPSDAGDLTDGRVLLWPALVIAGIGVATLRGDRVLLPILLAGVLVPPAFSGKYRPILDGRYLMPLLPVLFVGVGQLVAGTASWLNFGPKSRLVGLAALAIVAGALMMQQLARLDQFYKTTLDNGYSNLLLLGTLEQVQAARSRDEAVLLDTHLVEVKNAGGGFASSNLGWLLAVSGVPTETWRDDDGPDALRGHVVILRRTTADRLDSLLTLRPLDGRRLNGRDRPNFRAYRVGD